MDWGAGNWPGDWHASFGLDKLGDHKQLTLRGAWPRSRSAVHQLVPTRHWQAPDGVPPAVWRAHIVDALKEPPDWKPEVDAQWSQLCAWAEDALRCAHHHVCETAASQGRTLAGLRDSGRPSAPTSVSKALVWHSAALENRPEALTLAKMPGSSSNLATSWVGSCRPGGNREKGASSRGFNARLKQAGLLTWPARTSVRPSTKSSAASRRNKANGGGLVCKSGGLEWRSAARRPPLDYTAARHTCCPP